MAVLKTSAKNLEDVHEMNLAAIIKLMLKKKVCSRAELAQETGLRQSTVTNLINELLHCGLVTETGNIDGKKGRRSIGVALCADTLSVIGIRLARTYFTAGLFLLDGTPQKTVRYDIPDVGTPSSLLDQMEEAANLFIQGSTRPVISAGIAAPGPLSAGEDNIAFVTGRNDWDKIPFRTALADRLKLPVYMEQDANAGALAELWFGNNPFSRETFVYVAAGQGIGAGIVEDGRIFHGGAGMAGEIGHMSIHFDGPCCQCGNRGCLELYCSTTALMRNVRAALESGRKTCLQKDATFTELVAAVEQGDALACEQADAACRFLGLGLTNIINLYSPDTIIVGDEMSALGARMMGVLEETIAQRVLPAVRARLHIRQTSFFPDPALPGAAALAIDRMLQKPTSLMKAVEARQPLCDMQSEG